MTISSKKNYGKCSINFEHYSCLTKMPRQIMQAQIRVFPVCYSDKHCHDNQFENRKRKVIKILEHFPYPECKGIIDIDALLTPSISQSLAGNPQNNYRRPEREENVL